MRASRPSPFIYWMPCQLLRPTKYDRKYHSLIPTDADPNREALSKGRCCLLFVLRLAHATKTEMIRSGVELSFAAPAGDVARAVLVGAKERAAALHPFLHARFAWIKTTSRPSWIGRNFATRLQRRVVVSAIPI